MTRPVLAVGAAENGGVDYGLVRRLQAEVAGKLTAAKQSRGDGAGRPLSDGDERQLALSLARRAILDHQRRELGAGRTPGDPAMDQRLLDAIDAAMYGAGSLQELLDDNAVENIDINGCDEVWVTYADDRGKRRGPRVAADDDELVDIVRTLASYGRTARPFTPAHPQLDLRLPDGSRLSGVIVAPERPAISIRRNRFPDISLAQLVQMGSIDPQAAAFLSAAVKGRANIMIAGATDSGKTTLARALMCEMPCEERLVVIENLLELGIRRHPERHPDVVELETVLPDSDGAGGVSIAELVRRSRRMNPSRVIVGEVMGPEVVEMLSAMAQGNDGSLSTLHARSADEVYQRLATEAAKAERLEFATTYALIASAIDFVVYVKKVRQLGGRRAVTEIAEVSGLSPSGVARSQIFAPGPAGLAERRADTAIARAELLADGGYYDSGSWPGSPEPPHGRNGARNGWRP